MAVNEKAGEKLPCIKDFTEDQLKAQLKNWSEQAYRAEQIFSWIYQHGVTAFTGMKNLPAHLQEKLSHCYRLSTLQILTTRKSKDGTEKYVFRLDDGNLIETVLIPARNRQTVCVSTQVGCRYRCGFCASGQNGWKRNLAAGEIIDQILYVRFVRNVPVSNVVFMGMGEPFDNLENTVTAILNIKNPHGLNIGSRRITVSTAGHIPGIEKFSQLHWQVELSVSLHAVDDSIRSKLMPINRIYPLAKLLGVCRSYVKKTGRLITFEYVLIKGVNDDVQQARELARIAKWVGAKINLIPCSAIPGEKYQPPEKESRERFLQELEKSRVCFTLRRSRGKDIQAACGQLTGKYVSGNNF